MHYEFNLVSFTDPFDQTSLAISIGLRWMLIWPFDAKAAGIGTLMRDGGTAVFPGDVAGFRIGI
jgi:hypothetical protein